METLQFKRRNLLDDKALRSLQVGSQPNTDPTSAKHQFSFHPSAPNRLLSQDDATFSANSGTEISEDNGMSAENDVSLEKHLQTQEKQEMTYLEHLVVLNANKMLAREQASASSAKQTRSKWQLTEEGDEYADRKALTGTKEPQRHRTTSEDDYDWTLVAFQSCHDQGFAPKRRLEEESTTADSLDQPTTSTNVKLLLRNLEQEQMTRLRTRADKYSLHCQIEAREFDDSADPYRTPVPVSPAMRRTDRGNAKVLRKRESIDQSWNSPFKPDSGSDLDEPFKQPRPFRRTRREASYSASPDSVDRVDQKAGLRAMFDKISNNSEAKQHFTFESPRLDR